MIPHSGPDVLRAAFVMELALGHATHYRNFRQATEQHADIAPVWLPVPFEPTGLSRYTPILRSNWSVRASLRARRALAAAGAPARFDALFFHTQVTSLFCIDLMRRVPTIVSMDATPINYDSLAEHYHHRPAGTGFVDRQKYQLNRRAFHAAAGLVTWSDWARRSLVQDYGVEAGRVRVIPPGVPPVYFDIGRARIAGARRTSTDRLSLLFVGGDFTRKGGPLLLDLMRGPLGARCELHVVTQAELPAQPNVVVHRGITANTDALLRLYAESDVFVMPTQADCLGVVLHEAAASALPVITTDIAGVGESVEDGHSGLLIAPGDGRALTAAVATLVDDPARRRTMGRAGFALASRQFDAVRNNRAILDYMRELVAARSAGRAHERARLARSLGAVDHARS